MQTGKRKLHTENGFLIMENQDDVHEYFNYLCHEIGIDPHTVKGLKIKD